MDGVAGRLGPGLISTNEITWIQLAVFENKSLYGKTFWDLICFHHKGFPLHERRAQIKLGCTCFILLCLYDNFLSKYSIKVANCNWWKKGFKMVSFFSKMLPRIISNHLFFIHHLKGQGHNTIWKLIGLFYGTSGNFRWLYKATWGKVSPFWTTLAPD